MSAPRVIKVTKVILVLRAFRVSKVTKVILVLRVFRARLV